MVKPSKCKQLTYFGFTEFIPLFKKRFHRITSLILKKKGFTELLPLCKKKPPKSIRLHTQILQIVQHQLSILRCSQTILSPALWLN